MNSEPTARNADQPLVDLPRRIAESKQATPSQVALASLLARYLDALEARTGL